ncbi:C40 family peptidase [Streptomyces sp. NPDC058471]|uniref:C40 family peptidase n=1 Tax=Streptomyces sp. NPDC058471 TaxID=3346516 RepID=UPI003669CEDC
MSGAKKAAALGCGLPLVLIAGVLGLCVLFVAAVAGGAAEQKAEAGGGAPGVSQGVPAKVAGVNPVMLAAYSNAADRIHGVRPKCSGVRWSVIAGIGKVESNHAGGRKISPAGNITPHILGPRLDGSGVGGNTTAFKDTDNGRWDGDAHSERAVGPMQFLPSTWEGVSGQDGNNDGKKNPHNAFDAALGTATYLCGTGKNDLGNDAQLRKAILRYNQSGKYADDVTGFIRQYDQLAPSTDNSAAGGRAGDVIQAALAQQGRPYVWGGGSTSGPTKGGFDCSGLLVYAFYKGAHITLPRTSQAMRSLKGAVSRSDLKPGDIIVINNDGNWGHVGLYIGGGKMVHAPRTGKNVETTPVTTGYWTQYDWAIRRVLR